MKYSSAAAVAAALMLISAVGGVAAGGAGSPAKPGGTAESRSHAERPMGPEALIFGNGGSGILDGAKGPQEQCGEEAQICEEAKEDGGGVITYEDDKPRPGAAKKLP